MDIEVRGAEQFRTLAGRLRRVAGGAIPRAATAGIVTATAGLEGRVRGSLANGLPRAGGLASVMGQQTRLDVTPVPGGVHISGSAPYNLAGIDGGTVHHPLYGNRGHWFSQRVPAGLFSKPIQDEEPRFVEAVRASVRDATSLKGP